jgi:orotate phosphoribosyltransferase
MEAVKAEREAGAEVALVISIVDRGAAELYESERIVLDWLFRADEFLAS